MRPCDEEINLALHQFIDEMKECTGGGKRDIFPMSHLHKTEA